MSRKCPPRRRYPTRRRYLKAAAAGSLGAIAASTGSVVNANSQPTSNVPELTVGGHDYDRVKSIQDGRHGIDGFDVKFIPDDIYSLNRRAFGKEQSYDVSEVGLIPYVMQYANANHRAYTLLPIFVSRTFRHRNIYVRTDGKIKTPEDLRGKVVGTPGYGMSSHTWIRGFLQDIYGIKPSDLFWVESGKSSDGGQTNSKLARYFLPDDFPIKKGPADKDESELLLSGEVDALITAIEPKAYKEGDPKIRRLFTNVRAVEQDYFRKTNVFPIMHAISIRKDVADAHPDLPKSLFSMYCQAKNVAYEDLALGGVLKVALPWLNQEFEDTKAIMGDNYWKYGFAANRKELDLVMRYTHEQGLTKRKLATEEVFHPSTLELVDQ